jgi:hypothetical protein
MLDFYRNESIIGRLLALYVASPGRYSVDALIRVDGAPIQIKRGFYQDGPRG